MRKFITLVFAVSAVGALTLGTLPAQLPGELKAVTLLLTRVDVVTDVEVITVIDLPMGTPFNLLELQSGVLTAIGVSLPTGTMVHQVRLIVVGASIRFDGVSSPLGVPGMTVKLLVQGGLEIDTDSDAVFEFDVDKQLVVNKKGFKLKPVIKVSPIP